MSTTDETEEFRRRLRLIMQQFGSVAELARAVGVSDNAIYKWVSGRGQPSMISLVNLARTARVSIEWLATGQDAAKADAPGVESADYDHLPNGAIRTPGARGTIQSRQIVDDLAFKSEWLRRRLGLEPKNVMLVEAVSDSMAPTIDIGDIVIVDVRDARVRHDGVYVLRNAGELSIKRVQRRPDGKLVLRNDNPAYEPAVVSPESIAVLGNVVWIGGHL